MREKNIPMVDLKSQYLKIKDQIDSALIKTVESTKFINGPEVLEFSSSFAKYLNTKHVITCANGTDALQIALMALDLKAGDEVICPSFTYVATAEVISLLGLVPVMADVDPYTFNITEDLIKPLITNKTRVIVPVHLFGQSCDMEGIMNIAKQYNLYVVEDNAQSIGAEYKFSDGTIKKTGTIGHMGTTSFFPSKNLGCYGDGGAIFTNDSLIAKKLKMISNHGQEIKYFHKITGCNSRLDSIQAAILNVKLNYLNEYNNSRNKMAEKYDESFCDIKNIILPKRQYNSTHVFHQYTLKVEKSIRKNLIEFLKRFDIPAMIYYPIPLYKQEAFSHYVDEKFEFSNVEDLCNTVLSLPIHTEIESSNQDFIIDKITKYFK